MATRRWMIKGPLNIPERKKPTQVQLDGETNTHQVEIAEKPESTVKGGKPTTFVKTELTEKPVPAESPLLSEPPALAEECLPVELPVQPEPLIPPSSPSKLLTRRIKAIPRLGQQRRISFSVHGSASESEDDSKRVNNRIRNDSVCSCASSHASQPPEEPLPIKREFINRVSRYIRRNEYTFKYSEARKNFQRKFVGQIPDRQKLTMMDLLFYNPATNTMSESKKHTANLMNGVEDEHVDKILQDEAVDDPQKDNTNDTTSEKGEDEMSGGMPAPQIKIGPNGEIMIDEKSLVIENPTTKVNRNLMKNLNIVDGDTDVSIGYRKTKRSKEWTKSETIRFYNALNTIGTDFMLMCELFPNRTRKELKMKFKKEEKNNRNLVDKALTQPRQFDMHDLFKELEKEKEEIEDMKRLQEERKKIKAEQKNIKTKLKNGIFVPVDDKNDASQPAKKRIREFDKYEQYETDYLKGGILSVLQDSDEDEFGNEEIIINNKPTRSGRMPKPRHIHTAFRFDDEKPRRKRIARRFFRKPGRPRKEIKEASPSPIPPQPGSLMIVSNKSETGEEVLKVFMVTDDQQPTELTLDSEILQNLAQSSGAQNILTISTKLCEEPIIENNVTIAEDGGGSMRTAAVVTEELH